MVYQVRACAHFRLEVSGSCCFAPASSISGCFRDTIERNQSFTNGQIAQDHIPERSSCIGDLGVWAARHRNIVAEDCTTVSSRPRTRSVQFRPRSRRFPAAVIHPLAGGNVPNVKRNVSDLLVHASLAVSCARVMARTTRYQRYIDDSAEHRQL